MALVTPLKKGTSAEVDALAAFFDETLGFTPNSVLTMQRRPEIATAFIALNKAVMSNAGRVTSEQKRLIGYLASLSSGCRYCQAHTALAAKRYGASDERLHAIWQYRDSPLFTQAERAAFDFAVAASAVPNAVDDAIAGALHAHWSDEEIVEILGVISLFGFLNRWNDSMGTTLESGASTLASEHLGDSGWEAGKHR
ncbi:MAG: carboxymuconolactone decarboxylase family protein [Lysobacter sp.]|nr:carboxymuconolactone decarboxylase family protein [Lysobacter sp.]MDQ3269330.1 carboxymuconolactone decarboxylase family protein [Pseudomonadota bacterium]